MCASFSSSGEAGSLSPAVLTISISLKTFLSRPQIR